ncbi:rhamnogalacturonan acetylesterase [Microbacterium hibisci]|uniref:rhamnogalacturonan acetylesterase n=1 Tax=Microbacterium hibisci TaxID=2036000 RepID=UPI0019412817|nr:rhamnogalacturonan acetylesterase [Microbacterium hibisci]
MRLIVTGDSTAADYPVDRAPLAGWGQALGARDDLEVINHARPGASTRSFIATGLLDGALEDVRGGDLLLVCFGHNDGKEGERFSDPEVTFPANLRRFVATGRARGATPVLLTPIERRHFVDGRLRPTHGRYPDQARAIARLEQVPLIDLTAETAVLWQRQGPEDSKRAFMWLDPGTWAAYPDGQQDDTHLRADGAVLVAELVYAGLAANGLLTDPRVLAGR